MLKKKLKKESEKKEAAPRARVGRAGATAR
jgi:hypothetical protein